MPRLIIKNIVLMNVAELQQTEELWRSIMKRKQLGMGHLEPALNVRFS
jgi:hypothetical protein